MYYGAEIANKTYAHTTFLLKSTDTASSEAKGGSATLAGRKYLMLWVESGANPVYWSFDSTMTPSNCQSKASGILTDGQIDILPVGPFLQVYICTGATGVSSFVSVTEIA